jgi:pimeloyl-ACP methyl ester carboxylesterase
VEYNENGCQSKEVIRTSPIGDSDAVLQETWLSRIILRNRFYTPFLNHLAGRIIQFPYDFRLLLDKNYLDRLFSEYQTFFITNPRLYTIFCHSLGGLVFHDFLLRHPEVHPYIDSIVYINTPFDGCELPVRYISGNPHPFLRSVRGLPLFGGFYWCLPWRDGSREDMITNPHIRNLYKTDLLPRKKNRLRPLAVKTFLFHSRLPDRRIGDGVVPYDSLTVPLNHWPDVVVRSFPDTKHSSIMQDPAFLNNCAELLLDPSASPNQR